MIDLRTTLLWWVLTRYHVWAIGSALLAVWAFVEAGNEPDHNTSILVGLVCALLACIHLYIWDQAHRHRERVRGLIRARVEDADAAWLKAGRPWIALMGVPIRVEYRWHRDNALSAALRRPDLWGKWMLNVYCGETDTPFASGCDSWPRWVWEPVKG